MNERNLLCAQNLQIPTYNHLLRLGPLTTKGLREKSWAVFTTLHFLCNLWIRPTSQSVALFYAEKTCQRQHSSLLGAFVSYKENEVLWIRPLWHYSQHFIFFTAYEWSQQARALHFSGLERLAKDKCTSLLGTSISYKENEVWWTGPPGQYSRHFIFFVTYGWAQQARALYYSRLERLAKDKHSSLLGSFVSYNEIEELWIRPLWHCLQHFIFFIAYKYTQQAKALHYSKLERLTKDKHSGLLGVFVSYKENEVSWIRPLISLW